MQMVSALSSCLDEDSAGVDTTTHSTNNWQGLCAQDWDEKTAHIKMVHPLWGMPLEDWVQN